MLMTIIPGAAVGIATLTLGMAVSAGPATASASAAPAPANCGTIKDRVGTSHVVLADPSPTGTPPCTEGRSVMTEYFQRFDQAEGSGKFLTVRGWECGTNASPNGDGRTSCGRGDQRFHDLGQTGG